MKSVRLGYLTYGLDRSPTGIGRHAVDLLQALKAQPNSPQIVLLTTEREDNFGLWQQFENYPLRGCYRLPGLLTLGNWSLNHAIKKYKLDLLHDPNGIAPFLFPTRAKRIVTIHDTIGYVYPQLHNRLDNWRYRLQLPFCARQAQAVMTISKFSRQDLLRFLKLKQNKLHVSANGVESVFKPGRAAQIEPVLKRYEIAAPYLLYVGGLNARKNLPRLLEAFAQVRPHYPQLKLVIGGKRQWHHQEIDLALKKYNLEPAVHFTGYIDDADLPMVYAGAELFVFPSLYEGFGLPPLEAMACGTPVVCSNTSSLPEVVGDAALTVDPYDVKGLAEAIERVLGDPILQEDLRQKGLARAAQFSWERTARETLKVYQQVLQQA